MNGLNDAYLESIIKKAISGGLTTGQAAAKLGITKQYVNKLKRLYARDGRSAFQHRSKGNPPKWKTDPGTEAMIIGLYRSKYANFNFRHFLERLNETEGIAITYKPLHRILTAASFSSPTRRRARKEKASHPSRSRRKCFGEPLQIDASIHAWFGEAPPKAALHGAVMGLHFDKEETLRVIMR